MTPFGVKMRSLRQKRGLDNKGSGSVFGCFFCLYFCFGAWQAWPAIPAFVDQICVWLELIWDEAELLKYLAQMSHPSPGLATASLRRKQPFWPICWRKILTVFQRMNVASFSRRFRAI